MSYLVVDYGTSSCRASLVDELGSIVSSCRKSVSVLNDGHTAEIDTGKAWSTVSSVIRELLEKNHKPEIRAVGVSSLLGWVFLDSGNRPLGNSIIWMDSRSSGCLDSEIMKEKDLVYKKTGRRLSPELLISKLAWLRANNPDLLECTAKIISLKDELLRRLTGEIVTDYAHLNYTMLWNIGEHRMDADMLELAGVSPSLLAEGGYPYEQAGRISPEAAAATGLRKGLPVILGAIDGTTAMYGGGIATASSGTLVSGTTDVFMTLLDAAELEALGNNDVLTVNTGMLPGFFAAGGSTGVSGGALTKMSELLGGDSSDLLEGASKVPPGADGLLFCPGLTGERAPYWNADISGSFIGLRMNHERGHIIRALMEGAAFRLKRLFLELFGNTSGPERIFTVGGCSNIELWNSLKADVTGMTLIKPAELEATTIGTALFCECFFNGADKMSSVSGKWLKPDTVYSPVQVNNILYNDLFRIYEQFIKTNIGNYAALSSFKG
ncbi:MAG: hypothetical protein JEZ04_15450 [Spirochaetales bacterium]|nr:hypothetical protein [Spirochaetales bacterium]